MANSFPNKHLLRSDDILTHAHTHTHKELTCISKLLKVLLTFLPAHLIALLYSGLQLLISRWRSLSIRPSSPSLAPVPLSFVLWLPQIQAISFVEDISSQNQVSSAVLCAFLFAICSVLRYGKMGLSAGVVPLHPK